MKKSGAPWIKRKSDQILWGVAQERYFYRVGEMTENDIYLLRKSIIKPIANPILRESADSWIPTVQKIFLYRKQLLAIGISETEVDRAVDTYTKKIGEDYQGLIEKSGIIHLDSLLQSNFFSITSQENYMDFIFFLMSQYFRTLRIKENLKRNIEGQFPGYIDRSIATIIPIMATVTTSAIINGTRGLKPYLITNKSDLNFITGDQPIINTFAVDISAETIVDHEEFYYPISPRKAFFLSKDEKLSTGNIVDIEIVRELNRKIAISAERQIFSSKEDELDAWVGSVGLHRT